MNWKRTGITRGASYHVREVGGNLYIDGYFAVFNSTYPLWENAYETIDPGAFDLSADKDVRALANHDSTLVLGRTTAGTLALKIDGRGLYGSILINQNDQDACNLYERVKRGDVTQCSFGFDILKEEVERRSNGETVWHLQKVKLYEVSICTFPAYEETSVQARKKELDLIRKNEKKPIIPGYGTPNAKKLSYKELKIWRGKALARLKK